MEDMYTEVRVKRIKETQSLWLYKYGSYTLFSMHFFSILDLSIWSKIEHYLLDVKLFHYSSPFCMKLYRHCKVKFIFGHMWGYNGSCRAFALFRVSKLLMGTARGSHCQTEGTHQFWPPEYGSLCAHKRLTKRGWEWGGGGPWVSHILTLR